MTPIQWKYTALQKQMRFTLAAYTPSNNDTAVALHKVLEEMSQVWQHMPQEERGCFVGEGRHR